MTTIDIAADMRRSEALRVYRPNIVEAVEDAVGSYGTLREWSVHARWNLIMTILGHLSYVTDVRGEDPPRDGPSIFPDVGWKWGKWCVGVWTDPGNRTNFGIDIGPLEICWRRKGYRQ